MTRVYFGAAACYQHEISVQPSFRSLLLDSATRKGGSQCGRTASFWWDIAAAPACVGLGLSETKYALCHSDSADDGEYGQPNRS
jgi:hypothetical protein